ncbi:type IV pilin [Haloplanus salilacus]|uniref:type IV pilin n=1 Tax=Haloplanus salilacus TaxID=2949994 RepID=UPI003CCE50A0
MRDSRDRAILWLGSLKRAIAPVVGVVLMVVLVIVLASVMSAMVASLGDRLEEPELDDSVIVFSSNLYR